MRLTRRIAIVALSAVMALAMLTACGGGETPSPGGGSGTGTGAGTGGSSDSSTDSGTGSGKDNTTVDPSTLTSRTAKYFARKGITGKKHYIKYYDRNKQWEFEEACDGVRKYYRNHAITASEQYARGQLWDISTKTSYEYDINGGDQGALDQYNNAIVTDYMVKNVSLVPSSLSEMSMKQVEPMTIDGKQYYCEQDTKESWPSVYYCFETADTEGLNLKFIVKVSGSNKSICDIRSIDSNFDPELLRIPEGRTIIRDGQLTEETTGKDSYPNN